VQAGETVVPAMIGQPGPAPSVAPRARAVQRLRVRFADWHKPFWMRDLLARIGVMDSAHRVLPAFTRSTVLDLYLAPGDFAFFRRAEGPASVRRLRRRGKELQVSEIVDLDHSAQTGLGQLHVLRRVEEAFQLPSSQGPAVPSTAGSVGSLPLG
jgi:hypothetical protein